MTPQPNIPQHDAHVQTALQAAFEFGREQYRARTKWAGYNVSRALLALAATMPMMPEVRSQKPEVSVVGGGNSLTGKIKWLLENRGAMTRAELDKELNADISNLCYILKSRGEIDIVGRGVTARVSLRKAVTV